MTDTCASAPVGLTDNRLSPEQAEKLQPLTMTVAQFRAISGLGHTKTWELIKDKKLEVTHVGRRALITHRSAVQLLLPATAGTETAPRRRGRPRKNTGPAAVEVAA